jgi:hypothetical protein
MDVARPERRPSPQLIPRLAICTTFAVTGPAATVERRRDAQEVVVAPASCAANAQSGLDLAGLLDLFDSGLQFLHREIV